MMQKDKANGAGDCIVLEILMELPPESIDETTKWFAKSHKVESFSEEARREAGERCEGISG